MVKKPWEISTEWGGVKRPGAFLNLVVKSKSANTYGADNGVYLNNKISHLVPVETGMILAF